MKDQPIEKLKRQSEIHSLASLLAYYSPNHHEVGPVCDPFKYEEVLDSLKAIAQPQEKMILTPFYKDYGDGKKIHAGYVIEIDDKIIVSYRGTMTSRETSNDLDFSKAKTTIKGQEYDIHNGFKTEYEAVLPSLSAVLQRKDTNKEISSCGHSLGGAMANIFALNMASNGQQVSCSTFGAPRIFSTDSALKYNKMVPNSFSFVDNRDPVTKIPPKSLGFGDVGKRVVLKISATYKDGHSMLETYDHTKINDEKNQFKERASTINVMKRYILSVMKLPDTVYKSIANPIKEKFKQFKEMSVGRINEAQVPRVRSITSKSANDGKVR